MADQTANQHKYKQTMVVIGWRGEGIGGVNEGMIWMDTKHNETIYGYTYKHAINKTNIGYCNRFRGN